MIGKHLIAVGPDGRTYSGTILSYFDNGTDYEVDRYIEFAHDNRSAGNGYGYLKEKLDQVKSIEIH